MATISKSLTVATKSGYLLTINVIPTGSSVTPVNDIQTWLHCADIWKSYTTIEQVLADASTLQALIASNNAVDYMVRSTSWASAVTANSSAMTYIGANAYCANKLLANSTWFDAIVNSTYIENVLNAKVPTMTSNTAPYGQVIFSTEDVGAYYGWMAFDGNSNTKWTGSNTSLPQWIGYKFTNPICVKAIGVKFGDNQYPNTTTTFKIQGSNDGSNWVDLSSSITTTSNTVDKYKCSNNNYYLYHRIYISAQTTGASYKGATSVLQFYGRAQS